MSTADHELDALAAACSAALPPAPRTFETDRQTFAGPLDALLAAVRAHDLHYAFDAEGRPDAIAAVRAALPTAEAELLDAVLDDVACELAAWQETLYRLAHAARQPPNGQNG